MISGATRGAGGAALGSHLVNAWGNEEVCTLEGRGLTAEGIKDQVAELTRMGSHARTRTPLYHLHADPPPGRPWTPDERAEYWRRTEAELGLEGRPFAAVMHLKHGREHEHRVYLRVHADGRAIRMDHDYARREKVGRIFEHDRGEPMVKGAHNRAVIAALDRECPDVAAAMRAAGLHEGPPARAALSPKQRAIQERHQGTATKAGVAAQVAAAWTASDGQEAFAAALADAGLRLARGDRKAVPVVVDGQGRAHELARLFAMHGKASGAPVPGKEAVAARIDVGGLTTAAELPVLVQAEAAPALDAGAAAPVPGQLCPPEPQAPAPAAVAPAEAPPATSSAGFRDGTQDSAAGMAKPGGGANGGGAGASLEDVGDAPGPLKPSASPEERAKHIAALAAYEERKAAAWARWVAAWNAQDRKGGGGAVPVSGGQGHGDVQQQAAEAARATAALLDRLREQWDRARSAAVLREAVTAFEAEAGRIRAADGIAPAPGSAAAGHGHGHDGAAGRGGASDGRDHLADPRTGGAGRGAAARPGDPEGGRGAEPDRGVAAGPHGGRGEPAQDRGEGRQAVRRAAAQVRLGQGLAAAPEAMARLRRARLELDPAWRERRDAHGRLRADRAHIVATLATHPHPDPVDRDPQARADRYASRLSQGYRERQAAVEIAQAEAMAAMKGRSVGTRLLAAVGISTPEQRRAEDAVSHALALTDEAEARQPSPADYKEVRANGAAHAYAAQQDTAKWERRPDVAEAMEKARLNVAVDVAAQAGDPAVSRALKLGDPAAARQVIQAREEEECRQAEELERQQAMQRPGGPATPGPGGPGPWGPR